MEIYILTFIINLLRQITMKKYKNSLWENKHWLDKVWGYCPSW